MKSDHDEQALLHFSRITISRQRTSTGYHLHRFCVFVYPGNVLGDRIDDVMTLLSFLRLEDVVSFLCSYHPSNLSFFLELNSKCFGQIKLAGIGGFDI